MESKSGSTLLSVLVVLSAGAALFVWSSATPSAPASDKPASDPQASDQQASNQQARAAGKPQRATVDASSLTDEPLDAWRLELLDLAFRTASALPLQPHVKNRSRAQASVVDDCIALDQPRRALGYIEQITNWRRGAGYADLAFHLAQHGETAAVQPLLDLAEEVSETAAKEDSALESAQDWKKDRIRARIAQTHAWLGRAREAARFAEGAVESESGKVAVVEAMHASADAFDEQMRRLDQVVLTGSFDQQRQALEACAQLFDRFYDDAERRTSAQEKIRTSWTKLPVPVRLELWMELAGFALDHEDASKALDLVQEAHAIMDGARWTPDLQIPMLARLATLRHRAGDAERAHSEVDAALASFDTQREKIVNIDRAGVLRSLAEAYAAMGDASASRKTYARAVEAGVENPNSRPRAEDLAATCRSMARQAVQPGDELLARMQQIHERLGAPW